MDPRRRRERPATSDGRWSSYFKDQFGVGTDARRFKQAWISKFNRSTSFDPQSMVQTSLINQATRARRGAGASFAGGRKVDLPRVSRGK
jgi:hypothetical protein